MTTPPGPDDPHDDPALLAAEQTAEYLRNTTTLSGAFRAVGLDPDAAIPHSLAEMFVRFGPATKKVCEDHRWNPDTLRMVAVLYAYWSAKLLEWAARAEDQGEAAMVAEAEAALRQDPPTDPSTGPSAAA